VRARAKIVATVEGAKIYLAMQKSGEDFADWLWGFTDGKAIQNSGPLPTKSALSEEISKQLKRRGFKFAGPVIVYAWMQAVGMVNDHAKDCSRRKALKG
jgi:DNA-3-methyladenine glycosylase I